jgi:hypothetical protein
MAAETLPPIVMWHYRGNPKELSSPVLKGWQGIVSQAIESTVTAAAYAANLYVQSDRNLTGYLVDTTVPHPEYWTAYTCPEETATKTDSLIRLVYGAWLGIYGDHKLIDTTTKQIKRVHNEMALENPTLADLAAVFGRLVVPDLVNRILPGTPWKPSREAMTVPAFPKMPDEATAALWRAARLPGVNET